MKRCLALGLLCATGGWAQTLTLERVETTPGLTPASVEAVLQKSLALWPACGLRALPEVAEPDGRVSLSFRIGPSGKIVDRRSYEKPVTVRGPFPEDCVGEAIASATFPPPQWGQPVEVECTVRFQLDKQALDEQRRRFKSELAEWCTAYGQAIKAKGADEYSAARVAFSTVLKAHGVKANALTAEDLLRSTVSLPTRTLFRLQGGLETMQQVVAEWGVPGFCPQKR